MLSHIFKSTFIFIYLKGNKRERERRGCGKERVRKERERKKKNLLSAASLPQIPATVSDSPGLSQKLEASLLCEWQTQELELLSVLLGAHIFQGAGSRLDPRYSDMCYTDIPSSR